MGRYANRLFPTVRIASGLLLAALLSLVGYQAFRPRTSNAPEAPLMRADEMSWLNNWIGAEPLYRRAELEFIQRHQLSKALYAQVSEMPAHTKSSTTGPSCHLHDCSLHPATFGQYPNPPTSAPSQPHECVVTARHGEIRAAMNAGSTSRKAPPCPRGRSVQSVTDQCVTVPARFFPRAAEAQTMPPNSAPTIPRLMASCPVR